MNSIQTETKTVHFQAKRQMEEKLEAFLADNALLSSSGASSSYHLAALSSSTCSDSSPSPSPAAAPAVSTPVTTTGSTSLTVPASSSRRSSITPPVMAVDSDALKLLSDGSARFIHLQIMELVADCLQKSKHDALTSAYFYELSQNLEDLLEEV